MSVAKEILRIYICDNEEAELLLVEQALENIAKQQFFPWKLEVCTCLDWKTTLTACRTDTYHILILDIEMPGMSGFEIAEKLWAEQNNLPVVFVSRHEQYVYDVFDYSPFCFVRKSCLEQDLNKMLKKYAKNTASFQIRYKVSDGYSSRNLLLKDIIYFECNTHDIMVVLDKSIYHIYGTLKTTESELPVKDFIRVHKNYIINKAYIAHIGAREIELLNGFVLPMSRERKKKIKEEMSCYDRKLF